MVDSVVHLTVRIAAGTGHWRRLLGALLLLLACAWGSAAQAQSCGTASNPGNAPANWHSYCWLDLATYNDNLARSASGQTMSFNLSDGSVLTFNLRVTGGTTTAYNTVAAPS